MKTVQYNFHSTSHSLLLAALVYVPLTHPVTIIVCMFFDYDHINFLELYSV